jgi:hypothetical protein
MRIIPAIIIGRRTQHKLPTSFCAPALAIGNLTSLVAVLTAGALVLAGCGRPGSSMLSTSKITAANYDHLASPMAADHSSRQGNAISPKEIRQAMRVTNKL